MMTAVDDITELADSLFDVSAVVASGGERLLILGLESTPSRNLDDFGHASGKFQMYGYRAHVAPRLERLLDLIRAQGYHATPLGSYGYPLQGEVNLKELAIRAGIGGRGKSSVVLHPRYGTRLRFIAVSTDAPLTVSADREEKTSEFCRDCTRCLDICPLKVLEPYRLTDRERCLSNITELDRRGHSILCDECLKQCPANRPVA